LDFSPSDPKPTRHVARRPFPYFKARKGPSQPCQLWVEVLPQTHLGTFFVSALSGESSCELDLFRKHLDISEQFRLSLGFVSTSHWSLQTSQFSKPGFHSFRN